MDKSELGKQIAQLDVILDPRQFYFSEKSVKTGQIDIYEKGVYFSHLNKCYGSSEIIEVKSKSGKGHISLIDGNKVVFGVWEPSSFGDKYVTDRLMTKGAVNALNGLKAAVKLAPEIKEHLRNEAAWASIVSARPLFMIILFVVFIIAFASWFTASPIVSIILGCISLLYLLSYIFMAVKHRRGKDIQGIWYIIYWGVLALAGVFAICGSIARFINYFISVYK